MRNQTERWSWYVGLIGIFLATFRHLLAEGPATPSDAGWPQWRGPTSDAVSTEADLADSWPAEGPPVLWARELGQGYSSFIAVGSHVFTQTQTLYEQAVVCLEADTGKTVWSTRYGWPYEGGGLYPGPRSTPAWHEGRIYYAAPDGTIGCLDAKSGSPIWSVNPTKQFRGRGTDFGYACSPVTSDQKVIVPVGGDEASVVALNAKDGSVEWKSGESSASYASPLPITWKERKLVVCLLENSLAIFDVATGKLEFEDTFSSDYDEHSAAPLYREPLLMMAGAFRSGARCLRLDDSAKDGEQPSLQIQHAWDSAKFSNDVASSVLYDGRIYGFDLRDAQSRVNRPSRGEYRCLDFESGKILWSTDKVGHANTIVADGKLVLFNDRGEVILARVGTDQYEELARAAVFTDQICWSAAALHRGRLYLRTQTQAVCLYLGRQPLKTAEPVQTISAIPRVRAFDPTPLLGGEREYPATVPEWSELTWWYFWCVIALAVSAVLAAAVEWIFKFIYWRQGAELKLSDSRSRSFAHGVFWMATAGQGAICGPVLNHLQADYVFLWPLVLWTALQGTVLASTWAERQVARSRARWVSRVVGLLFLAICGTYFHLCRRLGLSIEWGFLTGLLPAFPVAAIASFGFLTRMRFHWLIVFGCSFASFTAYLGGAALFLKWWLQVGS